MLTALYLFSVYCELAKVDLLKKVPYPTEELHNRLEVVAADRFSVKRSQSDNVRISLAAAKNQVELKIALEQINLLLLSL